MAPRIRYVPRNSRTFNRLLRWTYGMFLRLVYRVEFRNASLVRDLKPPYVLLSNHVTLLDPFMLAAGCPRPVYWVTSDGNMRTRLLRFWLRRVGSIPKSKVIPDIETINWIVEVIRKRKGVVGIFPEGQASWDGRTLPILPSTAKLMKLLKVPIVGARIKGGYLSKPRWAWKGRRGKVVIEWELLLGAEEVRRLSAEEIFARLESGLAHDEYASQAAEPVEFKGRGRAESVELALYVCPGCGAIGKLASRGNRLRCRACASAWRFDRCGYLRPSRAGGQVEARVPEAGAPSRQALSVRDWGLWQAGSFAEAAAAARAEPDKPFLVDSGAILFRGYRMNPMQRIKTGTLALYPDRIELKTLVGELISKPLGDLDGIGVLKHNILDFYEGKTLWQVRFVKRSISARKWADAIMLFKQASPGADQG